MKITFTISILAFVLMSCSQTKELASQEVAPPPTAIPTSVPPGQKQGNGEYTLIDVSKNDSLFASINKGYCFGTCPVFKIKIYNSGYVSLEGIRHIEQIGFYNAKINQEKMESFSELAIRIDYMNLSDEYDNKYVSDLPATTTSIVIDGKRKTVRKRYDYPRSILSFEKLFMQLLDEVKWEKVK